MMSYIKSLLNLRKGEEDKEKVLENIKNNISFSGSNLWILAGAILIASVGLNVNSTAVVIGAMLISPLMGPIVGSGFALGIYDFDLLRKSLINLAIATLVGLLVSFLYFFVSPLKEAQSEILARTSPNLYDVLIAFFGGLVGVVAVTRVEKGNPIPGVAIATALMPPLCTAGFGIAAGNLSYFGGAIFLYIINCVFICIATYFGVKYLNYPAVRHLNKKEDKKVKWIMTAIVTALIIPSVYFAYQFYQEQDFNQKTHQFIVGEFESNGNTIVYQKTDKKSHPRKIVLAFLTKRFTNDEIKKLNEKLSYYGLKNTQLIIRQDKDFLTETDTERTIQTIQNSRDNVVNRLKIQLSNKTFQVDNLYPEAKALFSQLQSISVAKQEVFYAKDSSKVLPIALYQAEKPFSQEEMTRLRKWLKVRLNTDTLEIYKR